MRGYLGINQAQSGDQYIKLIYWLKLHTIIEIIVVYDSFVGN